MTAFVKLKQSSPGNEAIPTVHSQTRVSLAGPEWRQAAESAVAVVWSGSLSVLG